jgi:hypothetical protein
MGGWYGNTGIEHRTRGRSEKGAEKESRIVLSFHLFLFRLLRGTRTPSFARSAPMRAEDFFGSRIRKKESGGENGGPLKGPFEGFFSYVFPLSYIFLRDTGCKTRIIHLFIYDPNLIS